MRALAILLLFAPLPLKSARSEEPVPARAMVIASDRQTAEAALHILQAGGSAVDAAVAALLAMSVVEPQAAGIGGGAVLVRFDGATHEVSAWDGRETAPAAAIPGPPGEGRRSGGRAVGAPGALRMLEALHHEHGRLPWADLAAPAIRLAAQGAVVSADLARAIAAEQDWLRRQPAALGPFFAADGSPLAAGATLANPALAQTLHVIASNGANGLLHGPIAADIAIAARGDEKAGLLTTDDLAAYLPRHQAAICAPYRWGHICTTPPPSGGVVLLQILGLLDHTDFADQDPDGADSAALLAEAEELAMADEAQFLADPDFAAPKPGLLADPYLTARARLIDRLHAIHATPGAPDGATPGAPDGATQPAADTHRLPERGTSSVAIIDAQGNAVAMTASLGGPFGSHLFVHGFPLNAALADFTPARTEADAPTVANQIQPGKRPATALAPAIVLDGDGRLVAVIGSSGGAHIPAYEAQILAALLAWHMDGQRAIARPHIAAESTGVVVETQTLEAALTERGFTASVAAMPSRTVLFAATGVADPRGQGVALAP